MPLKQSELEDVYREIRALGYDAAVFAFDHAPPNGYGTGAVPIRPDVLVANTENHKQKLYAAANGAWASAFVHDLRDGMFGPAPKGVPLAEINTQK